MRSFEDSVQERTPVSVVLKGGKRGVENFFSTISGEGMDDESRPANPRTTVGVNHGHKRDRQREKSGRKKDRHRHGGFLGRRGDSGCLTGVGDNRGRGEWYKLREKVGEPATQLPARKPDGVRNVLVLVGRGAILVAGTN